MIPLLARCKPKARKALTTAIGLEGPLLGQHSRRSNGQGVCMQSPLASTAIASIFLVTLAGGCSQQMNPLPEESGTVEKPATPLPEPSDPPESSGSSGEQGASLTECEAAERGAIESTISAQTSAFADGDFERAYSYASPSFQTAVTLDAFTQLIATSYGPLINEAELRFGDCLSDYEFGVGTIDARFDQDGVDVFAIRYVMRATVEGWRIDGASNLELIGQGT